MWVKLSREDNVVVSAFDNTLPAGTSVTLADGTQFSLGKPIPSGHKVAIRAIEAGTAVLKYGHVIGQASCDISPGEHVHTDNVCMPSGPFTSDEHVVNARVFQADTVLPTTFKGYLRADGSAGVRNYVVVVASANCSATVVKEVCRRIEVRRPDIDGIIPVTHGAGCAQAIGGQNYELLNRTLSGWLFHPNVVAAVIIGLGCEGTTMTSILDRSAERTLHDHIPVETFTIQDIGGTAAAIDEGLRRVQKLVDHLPLFERTELPVSLLNLALNCGGSDSFSSLTANPALGVVSDLLIANGGTATLAEIPECTGTEEIFAGRCINSEVRIKLRHVFNWWQEYADAHHISLNDNLSPGNIAGGITTIIEKSLGAVTKGGTTPLVDVVDYSAPITAKGFVLMNTPGFDPVSVTGLVAGGCQMVAFTTGRGSVYGCAIAPTIKISTTSALFKRMPSDMDFDAGQVVQDGNPEKAAEALFRLLIDVAGGKKTCSEILGIGSEEFTPWPIGETL